MKLRHLLCSLALFATAATSALAQNFPTKPVTVLMPYTAGSPIDVIVRVVMTEAAPRLGQAIVVENKPGALTRLGIDQMRRAPADGYTLAVTTDGLSVTQPIADPEFKFESGRDYVPVSFLVQFPLLLAANKDVPAKDVKGLIEYAKAHPGKVTVAGGPGSISHIAFERFNRMTGGNMTFIPYKDTNQAFPDMVAGRIDLMFSGVNMRDAIQANMLKGLATTGDKRWIAFPNYPTLQESGVEMTTAFWMGIVAAPGTPKDVVTKLNQAIGAALQSETVLKRMAEFGMSHGPATPEQFDAFIKSELRTWTPIIKAAGIKVR
ncbi:MAG TPA: tripartite tricarboxylate transporter substrate binding protein [Ramlibacter sp.]|nr:tripartite tricarboxylate transporter substrate binding protein [Ramlibacter sp.]